jgi:hypothetical protein
MIAEYNLFVNWQSEKRLFVNYRLTTEGRRANMLPRQAIPNWLTSIEGPAPAGRDRRRSVQHETLPRISAGMKMKTLREFVAATLPVQWMARAASTNPNTRSEHHISGGASWI